jgi:mono/diheme cytochrome c family protein
VSPAVLLAVTSQQGIAVGIAIVMILGWVAYLVMTAVRSDAKPGSEVELAPNRRPYLDDEALEGPRLEKTLSWGLILLAFLAVGLPLYWLGEPSRANGAERGFEKRSVNRGAELFQSTSVHLPPGHIAAGCADCHGNAGQGGGVNFTISPDKKDPTNVISVKWAAPALNTVFLRFQAASQATPPGKPGDDQVRGILVYGRPPTPMPAWGVDGGGPLNDQQIDDLLAFLRSIQLKPGEAQKDPAQLIPQSGKSAADIGNDGKALFAGFCARCHTLGWSYRSSYPEPAAVMGGGAYGPNLTNGDTLRQFPGDSGRTDMIDFISMGSVPNKNYGRRGIGNGRMPGFGQMLKPEQIQAIVDYVRGL